MNDGPWVPMEQGEVNPELLATGAKLGVIGDDEQLEAWANHQYQAIARTDESGMTWLSIKRHDRHPIRNWRHLQQIKNECCGMEREAIELFPAESRLVDGANETHLWVFPENTKLPLGFPEGLVSTDADVESFNAGREAGRHQGRQEPWQDGLTTGRNENTNFLDEERRTKLREAGI